MKTMEIYEPAMCCSTGLCGVSINHELLRVATNLQNLKAHGIIVNRYNLNSAPSAFVNNAVVGKELQANGTNTLPLILIDGEIAIKGRYPSNEELCALLAIPREYLVDIQKASKNCCCNKKDG